MDKETLREVSWLLAPHWTDEEFEQAWVDFLLWRYRKELS
jgi:hypothetical protein